jgi:hypothetical protein
MLTTSLAIAQGSQSGSTSRIGVNTSAGRRWRRSSRVGRRRWPMIKRTSRTGEAGLERRREGELEMRTTSEERAVILPDRGMGCVSCERNPSDAENDDESL